ncbi:hypothetical protein HanPSC8_Chr09g0397731 [Helianthus annuus]|nr:hypothetical protein HanPSC8_Chr09g0397731 [Helianthus annuus]
MNSEGVPKKSTVRIDQDSQRDAIFLSSKTAAYEFRYLSLCTKHVAYRFKYEVRTRTRGGDLRVFFLGFINVLSLFFHFWA